MQTSDFDVAIVGGGPVGAAVAIALDRSGLSVAVLEARPDGHTGTDARTLAMSHGSRLILERLDVWRRLASVTPITTIHVSQRAGFGRTTLDAREAHAPALGYVVRYSELQRAFSERLADTAARLMAGAEVTALSATDDAVALSVDNRGQSLSLSARLLLVADGGNGLGARAGADIEVRDYEQHAVVGLLRCSRPHGSLAYERFTPDGPVALLPFEDRYALVWTATPSAADRLVSLDPATFVAELQAHFGDRAGKFESVEARARFPLALRYARDPVLQRTVMLGNAAQALHPIAGQGFNLGLRDAWELGDLLLRGAGEDPGSTQMLSRYRSIRRRDRAGGIALTHSLVKIFSNDVGPVRFLRGTALAALELFPPARRAFMQRMIFGSPE